LRKVEGKKKNSELLPALKRGGERLFCYGLLEKIFERERFGLLGKEKKGGHNLAGKGRGKGPRRSVAQKKRG